jgi:hypothetical protein
MGIKHINWMPGFNNQPPQKWYYTIGTTKEISNNDLMWQIRCCKEPGKVELIAAFKESKDAISFMTSVIFKNNKKDNETILGGSINGCIYSIEYNSSTEYVEL